MKKIYLVGASSIIGNSIINNFQEKKIPTEVIYVTRNPDHANDSNYTYIDSYNNLGTILKRNKPQKDDTIILAFAYLGKTGFDNSFPASLESINQEKVFDINFVQMRNALEASINYLKKSGGTIIYLSSAAAYPVRDSNIPYGLSKKYIDNLISLHRKYLSQFNVKILSVRIGFVDTPINNGRRKTPFSSTPEKVASNIFASLKKDRNIVYVPKSLFLVTKLLIIFPKITNFIDKKYS